MDEFPAVYAKRALFLSLTPSDAFLRLWLRGEGLEPTDDEYAAIYAEYEALALSLRSHVDTDWVARMERVATELEEMR